MKFRVTMKDPDTLHDAVRDAVKEDVSTLPLSEPERHAIRGMRFESVNEICARWFDYCEYLTVEIDTDAKTCTVVEVGK